MQIKLIILGLVAASQIGCTHLNSQLNRLLSPPPQPVYTSTANPVSVSDAERAEQILQMYRPSQVTSTSHTSSPPASNKMVNGQSNFHQGQLAGTKTDNQSTPGRQVSSDLRPNQVSQKDVVSRNTAQATPPPLISPKAKKAATPMTNKPQQPNTDNAVKSRHQSGNPGEPFFVFFVIGVVTCLVFVLRQMFQGRGFFDRLNDAAAGGGHTTHNPPPRPTRTFRPNGPTIVVRQGGRVRQFQHDDRGVIREV